MLCVGDGADACSWVDDDEDTADEANEEEMDVDDDEEDDDIIREVSRENTGKHEGYDPLRKVEKGTAITKTGFTTRAPVPPPPPLAPQRDTKAPEQRDTKATPEST